MMLLKECKKILTSIIYLIFIGTMVLFHVTQFGDIVGYNISQANSSSEYNPSNPLMIPPNGLENYGSTYAEIPEQVMPNVIRNLVIEYVSNEYHTYPIAFEKIVRLSEDKQQIIKSLIEDITGLSVQDALYKINEKTIQSHGVLQNYISYEGVITINVSYEDFKEKMTEINKLLGGGSTYTLNNFKYYGRTPLTYEDKLNEYADLINEDKITGSYARYFCDYMGIVAALFSIFVPVAFLMRDRRAKANEVIYSRKISTLKLLSSRYLALILMMLIPFILLSLFPLVQLMTFGAKHNLPVDIFAFVRYIMVWIFPTILTTTSVAFFFTILTDTPIAILIQFIWSFICLSSTELIGGYGLGIVIRHNGIGDFQIYKDGIREIFLNRISYSCFAMIILLISMLIYEQKRRGRFDSGGSFHKIFKNFKGSN